MTEVFIDRLDCVVKGSVSVGVVKQELAVVCRKRIGILTQVVQEYEELDLLEGLGPHRMNGKIVTLGSGEYLPVLVRLTPRFDSPILKFEATLAKSSDMRFRFTDLPGGVYTAEVGVSSSMRTENRWLISETIEVSGDVARDFTLPE